MNEHDVNVIFARALLDNGIVLLRAKHSTGRTNQKIRATSADTLDDRRLDLTAAWNDPTAPVELKKRIIRTLIHEVVVKVNHEAGRVELLLHWAGGAHTTLHVRKNRSGRNGRATDINVVELVRELAMGWPDSYIAPMLNRLGYDGTG